MGELLRKFTYQRNAFRRTAGQSAEAAFDAVGRASRQQLQTASDGTVKDEAFNDGKAFLGTVKRDEDGKPAVTEVGRVFCAMYAENPIDAWQWLVTRAMWRNSIPNGTESAANRHAVAMDLRFNFFDLVVRTLWHLAAHPRPGDVLYFDELIPVLNDDDVWVQGPDELYRRIIKRRNTSGTVAEADRRTLLGDLEEEYEISRDNMNTIFAKAFKQSGLFELVEDGSRSIGIRVGTAASRQPILARRLRFVLDHPSIWDGVE